MTFLEDALGLLPAGPPTRPSNLDELIVQLGVEVRYRRDRLAFNGSTDLRRDVPLIELAWVRRTDSPSLLPWGDGDRLSSGLPHQYDARTRFTLAHEFGHVLLDRLQARRPLPSAMTPRAVESLCDAIGAELLMPTQWCRTQFGEEPGLSDLRRVSIRAGTSISATVIRARHLGHGLAALHLVSGSYEQDWRVGRSYGFGPRLGLGLTAGSGHSLLGLPMKSVAQIQVQLTCADHVHRVRAEVRRTFNSAILIAHEIDGLGIRPTGSWRCPREQHPARRR